MTVQGALWLAKRYPSTLISVYLTGLRYFSYQAGTNWPHETGCTPFDSVGLFTEKVLPV